MEFKIISPKYGEKTVLLDPEDFELIKKYHWCITFVRGNWYAIHSFSENGVSKQIKMHRMIMGETDPAVKIDHRNHNGLDNRKDNLRRSTTAQNTQNNGLTQSNRTGYKGIYQYKSPNPNAGRWTASVKENGRKVFGGYYNTAIEAAAKYNELAIKYHKEFAFLNVINEDELRKAQETPRVKKQRTLYDQTQLKTGFRGVVLSNGIRSNPYRVMLKANGKNIVIGYYKTAIEAAKAYNEAIIKYGCDIRKINKIPE